MSNVTTVQEQLEREKIFSILAKKRDLFEKKFKIQQELQYLEDTKLWWDKEARPIASSEEIEKMSKLETEVEAQTKVLSENSENIDIAIKNLEETSRVIMEVGQKNDGMSELYKQALVETDREKYIEIYDEINSSANEKEASMSELYVLFQKIDKDCRIALENLELLKEKIESFRKTFVAQRMQAEQAKEFIETNIYDDDMDDSFMEEGEFENEKREKSEVKQEKGINFIQEVAAAAAAASAKTTKNETSEANEKTIEESQVESNEPEVLPPNRLRNL